VVVAAAAAAGAAAVVVVADGRNLAGKFQAPSSKLQIPNPNDCSQSLGFFLDV
jgi:hypothetical protein